MGSGFNFDRDHDVFCPAHFRIIEVNGIANNLTIERQFEGSVVRCPGEPKAKPVAGRECFEGQLDLPFFLPTHPDEVLSVTPMRAESLHLLNPYPSL